MDVGVGILRQPHAVEIALQAMPLKTLGQPAQDPEVLLTLLLVVDEEVVVLL